MSHLEKHKILTNLQHGFRSEHSCESQLVITMDDILGNFDDKSQTDVIILDFAKAFDTVPHKRLLSRLESYGIDGKIHNWIRSFLCNRHQRVILDGEGSELAPVRSGVPQGTVLGPILFLCYINDLPDCVKSQTRLFADDCLLYRAIKSVTDQLQLQRDLLSLEKWADSWGMSFNSKKCYLLSVNRPRVQKKLHYDYTLKNHTLEKVSENAYLGILLREGGQWSTHINKITKRASSTLGFLRRNLRHSSTKFKATAYTSLVRSTLEYSSVVWDPYQVTDIDKLEKVQKRAARFVKKDYGRYSSVSAMMQDLKWDTLENRRSDSRLTLMYKIRNGKVAIPADDYTKLNPRPKKNSQTLLVYSPQRDEYKNSFFPRTIVDWNKLPDEAVNSKSIEQFKASLMRQKHY